MSTDRYVYEFLYRGRPPGSSNPAAWHVILAQDVDLGDRTLTVPGEALTPAQAKDAGFGLPDVLTIMNAEALRQVDELTALVASTKAELVAAKTDLEAARHDADDLRARLAPPETATAAPPQTT